MKKMKNKLRSKAGESIAETLLALLIASFALMTLAGMITTANRIISESKEKMDEYYEQNATLETLDSSAPLTVNIEGKDTFPIKQTVSNLVYNDNQTFSGHPVLAYRLSED